MDYFALDLALLSPGFPSSKPGLKWMEFPWILLLAYIYPGLIYSLMDLFRTILFRGY
jgi:hypothetical protein